MALAPLLHDYAAYIYITLIYSQNNFSQDPLSIVFKFQDPFRFCLKYFSGPKILLHRPPSNLNNDRSLIPKPEIDSIYMHVTSLG